MPSKRLLETGKYEVLGAYENSEEREGQIQLYKVYSSGKGYPAYRNRCRREAWKYRDVQDEHGKALHDVR